MCPGAVTNCLKYAAASHLDIILKFSESFLHLYIFDNGRGCGEISEGNGIRGIRERVQKAGGEVRFVSESGEGFQISIRFPISVNSNKKGAYEYDKGSDSR